MAAPDQGQNRAAIGTKEGIGLGIAEILALAQIAATGTTLGLTIFVLANAVIALLLLVQAWRHRAAWTAVLATAILIAVAVFGGGFADRKLFAEPPVNPPTVSPTPVPTGTGTTSVPATVLPTIGTPTPSATVSPTAVGTGAAAGTQLASYSVTITAGSVPLGDHKPTQAENDVTCATGDICADGNFGSFDPIGVTTKEYLLQNNAAPTYDGCKTTMLTTNRVPIRVGETFCVLKPGRVAGVTITEVGSHVNDPLSFNVTVWSDPAS